VLHRARPLAKPPNALAGARAQRTDGWCDAPVVPGAGSAIFLHVARANYQPTVGCVAFAEPDLLTILSVLERGSQVDIRA
jgi:L,D-peptidoglycan transpeptidase YkuD (ErfK/YbiS/YcfS/YnhG family)